MPDAAPPHSAVQWDDSSLQELQGVNFCNVTTTIDEVTLLFGHGSQQGDQVHVQLFERIPLRPVAAKLLRDLLQKHLGDLETQHGPITQGYAPIPGSDVLPARQAAVATWPAELSPRAALLRELVEGLPVKHELERSWKFVPGQILTERFLLGLPCEALGASATIRLPVIWKRLNMPPAFLDEARRHLAQADFVHFGFEEGPNGCLYKVYLEQTAKLIEEGHEPKLLYTGYKWNPELPEEAAVSLYHAQPRLTLAAMQATVDAEMPDGEISSLRSVTQRLLDLAAGRVETRKLLLVTVRDDDGTRSSLDLNLYGAGLLVSEVYPLLIELAQTFSVPLAQVLQVYEEVKHCTLGHISAGRSRTGQPFFTLYYGGHSSRA